MAIWNSTLARRAPMRKKGKRTAKREAMNRRLNKLGIDHCELHLQGCAGRIMLTWAHSRKSRFLTTEADWLHACRACLPCHMIAEALPHEEMFRLVSGAIKSRITV